MKKLLLPIFSIVCVSQSAIGMESSPLKKAKPENENIQQKTTAEQKIASAISDLDASLMIPLLANNSCKALSYQQKTELYTLATERARDLQQIVELETRFVRNSNPDIKKRFSHEDYLEAIKKIETQLNVWRHLKNLRFPQALFNPQPYQRGPRITLDNTLEAFISAEQEQISACCFHLTLYNIAYALVARKNRGVIVELVTNQTQGDKPCLQALEHLARNGIALSCPKNKNFWETNHHKFFVFKNNVLGKPLLWAGSYNATGHSNENSWEDVIIQDDSEVIEDYIKRFSEIKLASQPITLQELQATQSYPSDYALKQNNVPKELWERTPAVPAAPAALKPPAQQQVRTLTPPNLLVNRSMQLTQTSAPARIQQVATHNVTPGAETPGSILERHDEEEELPPNPH